MKPFTDKPVFAFTADQDWAPEWASEFFLAELQRVGVPLHIFRTNPSAAFDNASDVDQGWHPNFLAGSSHGESPAEVIEYCKSNFPSATTARSHCFREDTFTWRALREAGIVADSQLGTLFQGYLQPVMHWTGIVRLPVYFEDDVFFDVAEGDLDLDKIVPTLFTPGLKILNFHPTFVACNTPSREYHERMKPRIFSEGSTRSDVTYEGRGTLHVFRELVERIVDGGGRFERFACVVELARSAMAREGIVPDKVFALKFKP